MNTAAQGKPFRINWVKLQSAAPMVGVAIFCVALGGWIDAIANHTISLSYEKQSTAKLEQVEKVAGPNPVATVNCLRRSNRVAKIVAGQAVVAASTDADVSVPNLKQIPNCPAGKLARD